MSDPAAPFVTFYDLATGERIELSGLTFANWVAKTANLLRDSLDAEPGMRVLLKLPMHWQAAVWAAACWHVGATVIVAEPGSVGTGGTAEADVAVFGPDEVDSAPEADHLVACALRPMAMGFAAPLPFGMIDYSTEVRGHGDYYGPAEQTPASQPVFEFGGHAWTGRELSATARRLASGWNLEPGGRLLTTDAASAAPGSEIDSWLSLLAVPREIAGSVVIVRNADQGSLEHIAEQERVTASRN